MLLNQLQLRTGYRLHVLDTSTANASEYIQTCLSMFNHFRKVEPATLRNVYIKRLCQLCLSFVFLFHL